MERDGLLPCSQGPSTGPYPRADEPSPYHHILVPEIRFNIILLLKKPKLHGLSPRANYTDRATAACRRSDCQLVRIKGATCRQEPLLFYQVAPQFVLTRLSAPRSRPTPFFFW
jgi:hypothetical protein